MASRLRRLYINERFSSLSMRGKALALSIMLLIVAALIIAPISLFSGRSQTAQASINWAVGDIVGLCAGTQIRTGPGTSYYIHTIVPEDNWAVKVIDGPRFANGQTWWDTSRREAGDPSGGTGWVSQQQAEVCPGGGGATPTPGGGLPTFLLIELGPDGTWYNLPWDNAGFSQDPVQTFTGSFTYQHTDTAIAGRGPVPAFTRSYNSNDTRISPLGQGWTHNYNTHLASPGDGTQNVILVGPQGRSELFTHNGGGSFTPPDDVHTKLVKNPDNSYTATLKDLTVWTFSPAGWLTRVTDRFGNHSDLLYNSAGQLVSISDPAGRGVLTLTYDPSTRRLASVSDWATPPRVVRFEYDAGGRRLLRALDREDNATSYEYDGTSHRLTTITDANGHVAVTNTYDSEGRVATQKDARGLTTGQQTTFLYTNNGDGTKSTTVTYPSTSFEPTWTYKEEDTYDDQARLTKHVSKPNSNPAEWVTEEYTYDVHSNRSTIKDGRGNTTQFCYDTDYTGATIAGNHGNLTRRIEPAAIAGGVRAVTLLKYDDKDNVIQTIAPKGVNSTASVTCATDLSSINTLYATDMTYSADGVNLLATTSRYTDPGTGVMASTTKFEYGDAANPGRATKIISPKGNSGPSPDYSFATILTYSSTGSKAGMLESTTNPEGNTTTYDYDAVGRQTKMVDPNGNAPGGVPADHTWEYVYDKEDRLRFAKAPAPTSGGAQLVTESRYDAVGNRTIAIDANGQVTRYLYDERDSLKEVHESPNTWTDPNIQPPGKIVTAYSYDHLGNLSRVTRAQGDAANERVVDYLSDGMGRTRKEVQYPNWPSTAATLVTESTYDQNSNPLTQKDPLNQVTTSLYDARNHLTNINYTNPNTPNVAYTYDLNGNRLSMVDGTGTTTYLYDEQDRLLSTTSPGDRTPNTVGYRYELNGNRAKLIYTDGSAITYSFDKADRLVSLRDWLNNVTGYQYNPDGNLKTIQNSNGTVALQSYDNAQRLTEIHHKLGENTISKHNYSMDAVGNRTRLDEVLPQNGVVKPIDPSRQATTQYSYDRLYRLMGENTTDYAATYTYDPEGNRRAKTLNGTTTTYLYDRADRITKEGNIQYVVDANGNLRERGRETYTYDQANRLINSRMPQPSQYIYDGDGKRWKTDAAQGPLDAHVYDVNAPLPLLLEDGRRKYIYGVGLAYTLEGNGTMEIYHTDGLGSTRAVTYRNGNVAQNYRYDAFGVLLGPPAPQGSHNQPMQYTGEERDKETQFTYLRARYYDPRLGRFVQRDPFAGFAINPQSLNRHSYVQNNPVNAVDPSGLTSSRVLGNACYYRPYCSANIQNGYSAPIPAPVPTPTPHPYGPWNPFQVDTNPRPELSISAGCSCSVGPSCSVGLLAGCGVNRLWIPPGSTCGAFVNCGWKPGCDCGLKISVGADVGVGMQVSKSIDLFSLIYDFGSDDIPYESAQLRR
jgi:RHS repeat-associated protein